LADYDRLVIEVGPRQVAYNDAPLLYAYNELQDLLTGGNGEAISGSPSRK
jgi:hypothetical protein